MHAMPYLTIPPSTVGRASGPATLARTLAAHPEHWQQLVQYRPDTRWYRVLERTHIHGHEHEVWLLSWLPGQGTDLHDHGPSCGALAVASGALTERVVAPRVADAPLEITRVLETGTVRAFGPRYVHQVSCTGATPAVSVHVYTPRLTTMNTYQLTTGQLIHTGIEQAGTSW